MLNSLPGLREYTVFLALVSGEARRERRLLGRDGMSVTSPQSLRSGIPNQGRLVGKPHVRLTKELQVMDSPALVAMPRMH
jgi:hypothetical protein